MATAGVHLHCRWCHRTFSLCQPCWHGNAYCCDACRVAGRRRSLREARARYQRTPAGRENHRVTQRRYRQNLRRRRRLQNCVMDQGTSSAVVSVDTSSPMTTDPIPVVESVGANQTSCCSRCRRRINYLPAWDGVGSIRRRFLRRRVFRDSS